MKLIASYRQIFKVFFRSKNNFLTCHQTEIGQFDEFTAWSEKRKYFKIFVRDKLMLCLGFLLNLNQEELVNQAE